MFCGIISLLVFLSQRLTQSRDRGQNPKLLNSVLGILNVLQVIILGTNYSYFFSEEPLSSEVLSISTQCSAEFEPRLGHTDLPIESERREIAAKNFFSLLPEIIDIQ